MRLLNITPTTTMVLWNATPTPRVQNEIIKLPSVADIQNGFENRLERNGAETAGTGLQMMMWRLFLPYIASRLIAKAHGDEKPSKGWRSWTFRLAESQLLPELIPFIVSKSEQLSELWENYKPFSYDQCIDFLRPIVGRLMLGRKSEYRDIYVAKSAAYQMGHEVADRVQSPSMLQADLKVLPEKAMELMRYLAQTGYDAALATPANYVDQQVWDISNSFEDKIGLVSAEKTRYGIYAAGGLLTAYVAGKALMGLSSAWGKHAFYPKAPVQHQHVTLQVLSAINGQNNSNDTKNKVIN